MKKICLAFLAIAIIFSGCVTSEVDITPAKVEKKEITIYATTQPSTSIILKVNSKKIEKVEEK